VPVWGTAEKGETVTVRFADQEANTQADAEGRWEVRLQLMSASSEPRTLTVESQNVAVAFSNVLVGEVWVCSGQSNMEMGLTNCQNAEAEIATAQFPDVRLFTVPKRTMMQPETDIPDGTWKVCTPETAPPFSGVAYFFGRELHRRLGVPIGLIDTSLGGTTAEAWTSRDGLLGDPKVREIVEEMDRNIPLWEQQRAEWQAKICALEERTKDIENLGFPQGWADFPCPSGEWREMEIPGLWQNRGHNVSGIFWFRKEVELPASWVGKNLVLSLGAADKSDISYFNNEKVGTVSMKEEPGAWSLPRVYPVPGRLAKAGRNVIAVRVHSDRYNGGLNGPASVMQLSCPALPDAKPLPLAGTWHYAIETNYGLVELPPEPLSPGNINMPCGLYNGMIAPLTPFAVRGAIWYQGESNAGRACQYRALFPALIRDWRKAWGQPDFAFYFVQLANHMAVKSIPDESQWAELREAQTLTLALPHTGMAVAIDIGEAEDIHPRNKQDVGLRLTLNALHQTYGQDSVIPCGPLFQEFQREGRSIRLAFHYVGEGLCAKGEPLQGFAIAGADRKFVWADARIEGETVVVSSPEVPDPVTVRYAWADNPVCNLYNAAGLPASPFRADDWNTPPTPAI